MSGADLWSSIADLLDDAERHPEVFVDARSQLSLSERREYAVRSAIADLAVRLAQGRTPALALM